MPRVINLGIALAAATISLAAAPASGALTWSIPTNTTSAVTEFDTHEFPSSVDTVSATLDATLPPGTQADVDVRGLRSDGTWSEWSELAPGATTELTADTRSVQARLMLTGSAVVRSLDITAWHTGHAVTARNATSEAGNTYTLFATREGLVGRTTANGHVITARDHFVALPSRRGLAKNGTGEYTVRICTTSGGRCEWAPVWDVGPWNTKDDFWNANRQSWPDLPQGKPESQAAYVDGYNGGLDQSGRKVRNPAGIDLADGAFWDGLGLTGNSWVNVTFQWTGSGAWGTVIAGQADVRSGPDGSAAQTGIATNRAQVRIECQLTGEPIDGLRGPSDLWYRLAPGKYVSGTAVEIGSPPSAC
jgi:hypothetical protein